MWRVAVVVNFNNFTNFFLYLTTLGDEFRCKYKICVCVFISKYVILLIWVFLCIFYLNFIIKIRLLFFFCCYVSPILEILLLLILLIQVVLISVCIFFFNHNSYRTPEIYFRFSFSFKLDGCFLIKIFVSFMN